MKRKIQSLVIVGLLLVIAIACQREERETLESKGISLEQAKAFFEKQETEKENNGIDFKITPKWETFKEEKQEDDINFASVEVFVNDDTDTKAQAFFSKKEKEIQLKLYFTSNEKDNTQWIVITDANGLFQEAFIQKSKSSLFEKKYKRRVVVTIGSDPEMPGVGTDDPNIEMVDQYGMTIPSSKRYLYAYKLQGIEDTEMNIIKGVLNKRILDEKVTQLPEVVLNYYYKPKHDIQNSLNLASIRTFFISQSRGINDFIHLERKKDRSRNTWSGGASPKPREIIDNLTNPCAKDLLKQLPNLKNDIAKLLRETFQTNDKYDIVFTEDNNLIGQNIDGTASGFKEIGRKKVATIALNPDILKTATKEYILVTMYHEAIHTYLNFERERLGKVDFEKRYPNIYMHHTQGIYNGKAYSKLQFLVHNPRNKEDHHFKFEKYINRLTNSILSFNPKMSRETAQAMAKVGIIRESELFDWEKQLNQNEREGKNHQGEKCN